MLKHQNVLWAFVLILLALLAYHIFVEPVHWLFYLVLFLIFSGLEFYGAAFVQSGFHVKSISTLPSKNKIVALTFDDGPDEIQTPKILEVLKTFGAKATFFCIGKKIRGKEHILQNIIKEGHEIGNHSFEHSYWYDLKNKKEFLLDLEMANNSIKEAIGTFPNYFRPPYGVTTPALGKACREKNFKVIGWNVRSLDTAQIDRKKVLERIKAKIQPGAIILLHDTVKDSDVLLAEILQFLQNEKYEVVPLKAYL